jgi:hypothetical protein
MSFITDIIKFLGGADLDKILDIIKGLKELIAELKTFWESPDTPNN